jgi:hypothetical protein
MNTAHGLVEEVDLRKHSTPLVRLSLFESGRAYLLYICLFLVVFSWSCSLALVLFLLLLALFSWSCSLGLVLLALSSSSCRRRCLVLLVFLVMAIRSITINVVKNNCLVLISDGPVCAFDPASLSILQEACGWLLSIVLCRCFVYWSQYRPFERISFSTIVLLPATS